MKEGSGEGAKSPAESLCLGVVRAELTCDSVHAEARRAEGRGPKGRGKILGVVNLWKTVVS